MEKVGSSVSSLVMSMGRMSMPKARPDLFSGSMLNNSFRTQLIKFSPDALLLHGRALNIYIHVQ